jgi:hypothetical protein
MPTNSTHLNPANPTHWLLLIYWFVATPSRLRQYRAGLGAEGEAALHKTGLGSVIILTTLPQLGLIGYLWLRTQSFGPGLDWYYYLPSLALLAGMLAAVAVALIYSKPDLVWVAGLAMTLMAALPVSVGFLANLVSVYLVFHEQLAFGEGGVMGNVPSMVISLALCVVAALLASVSMGLSRIATPGFTGLAKARETLRWIAGLRVGLVIGLLYGLGAGLVANPEGLSFLSYNYDVVNVESPAVEVMLGLVAVLTCLRLYQRGGNTVAMGVAVAILGAIVTTSMVATTLASVRIHGLLHGAYDGTLLSVVGLLNISLMTLIAAAGYGLLYVLAFLLARNVAAALTRRYIMEEPVTIDKPGSSTA